MRPYYVQVKTALKRDRLLLSQAIDRAAKPERRPIEDVQWCIGRRIFLRFISR